MRLFVAQPMTGIDEETINRKMHVVENFYKHLLPNEEVVLIDQVNIPIPEDKKKLSSDDLRKFLLGRSLNLMLNNAELVVFLPGWKRAKGCLVEMMTCREYDIPYVEPETLLDAMKRYRFEGDQASDIFPEIENIKTETISPLSMCGSEDVPSGELWVPDTNHELYDGQRVIAIHLPAYRIECFQELTVKVKPVNEFPKSEQVQIGLSRSHGYNIGFINMNVITSIGLDIYDPGDAQFNIYADAPVKSTNWFREYEHKWKEDNSSEA